MLPAAEPESKPGRASVLWTADFFGNHFRNRDHGNGGTPSPVLEKETLLAGKKEVLDLAGEFKAHGFELLEGETALFVKDTNLLFFSGRQEIIDRFPKVLVEDDAIETFPGTAIVTVQTRRRGGDGKTTMLSERHLIHRSGQAGLFEIREGEDLLLERLLVDPNEVSGGKWRGGTEGRPIHLKWQGNAEGCVYSYEGVVLCNFRTGEPVVFHTVADPGKDSVLEWSVRAEFWNPELPEEFRTLCRRWPDRFAEMVERSLRAAPQEEGTAPPISALYLLPFEDLYIEEKRTEIELGEETGLSGRMTLSLLNGMLREVEMLSASLLNKEGNRLWRLDGAGVVYARGSQALHDRLAILERLESDRDREQVRVILEELRANSQDSAKGVAPERRELRSWLGSTSGDHIKAGTSPRDGKNGETVEMEATSSRNLVDFNLAIGNFPMEENSKWTWRGQVPCLADGVTRAPLAGIVTADADGILHERKWTLRVEPVRSLAETALRDPEKRAALLREIEAALAAAEKR